MMKADIENFDVISYFEEKGIEYHTSGKNVTRGWVEINCPYCSDPSWHLGINLENKLFHCWICGETGDIIKLIREIEECSFARALKIIKEFQDNTFEFLKRDIKQRSYKNTYSILPPEATNNFLPIHLNYLKNRGFNPHYLIEKYDLKCCHYIGDYKLRIIIPIYENNQVVGFTSRDVTGKAKNKYKHCPNADSIIPVKECLYNLDNCPSNKVIVVEGVIDVWRIGDGAVAVFGTQCTREQIKKLSKFEHVHVMFDSDAIDEAKKLANRLIGLVKQVELIEIAEGDPAKLSEEEINKIKSLIINN